MIIANENTKYQLKQIITEIIYILNTELKQRTHYENDRISIKTHSNHQYIWASRVSALTLPPKISKTYSADFLNNKQTNIKTYNTSYTCSHM